MEPFPVIVRYRFSEGGESKGATFHGLPLERLETMVLGRLREAHRFAAWLEVVEVQWHDGVAPAAWEGHQHGRRYSVPRDRRRVYMESNTPSGCGWSGDMDVAASLRGERHEGRGVGDAAGWAPRRHARCTMFKPAHVVLDEAVLDCVLLDLSPGGAQVYLVARAEVPDRATLWLPGGESRSVWRRWQRGSHIGFEAVGDAVPPS